MCGKCAGPLYPSSSPGFSSFALPLVARVWVSACPDVAARLGSKQKALCLRKVWVYRGRTTWNAPEVEIVFKKKMPNRSVYLSSTQDLWVNGSRNYWPIAICSRTHIDRWTRAEITAGWDESCAFQRTQVRSQKKGVSAKKKCFSLLKWTTS